MGTERGRPWEENQIEHSLLSLVELFRKRIRRQRSMYGQGPYASGGNGRRIQNKYQSQGNDNHGEDFNTGMGEQQDSDPQQEHRNEQPVPQTPEGSQGASSCRVIHPNPVKREKLLTMARKEEEDYQRFKESQRPGPIHLTPKKVGGYKTESEARQQQQRTQAQSKYQKMMQREEYKKKQREEEEAKIQEMKDIQRKKAEKLEEKRQQQDLERKQRWHEDRCLRNNEFLDRLQPINDPYNRRFGQPSEWERNQTVKQERIMEKMREMDSEDERPYTTVNKEEDEDLMFLQALKDSLLTHKIEEETRLQEMKKPQHKQPTRQTYRQQQKEEEEKRLKAMKDEQRRQAEVLRQHEVERRLSQEEERRRVNRAFLDRLQGQNTSQHGYSGESNTWA